MTSAHLDYAAKLNEYGDQSGRHKVQYIYNFEFVRFKIFLRSWFTKKIVMRKIDK